MELEALLGHYGRLKSELAAAYQAVPWQSSRIDRLANDLADTEREIAARASGTAPDFSTAFMAQRTA